MKGEVVGKKEKIKPQGTWTERERERIFYMKLKKECYSENLRERRMKRKTERDKKINRYKQKRSKRDK